jgi:hypothetical protein
MPAAGIDQHHEAPVPHPRHFDIHCSVCHGHDWLWGGGDESDCAVALGTLIPPGLKGLPP